MNTSVGNGAGLWRKVCEKDPVASKGALSQMFWRRLYLPTCHHNRGSTELHGHKFAVCSFLELCIYHSPFGVIR